MGSILDEKELVRITSDFFGKEFTEATPEKQKQILDAYRKVEAETNQQIEEAGGVENWYASGMGRVLCFETK
jgi:hypothetical protein